MISNLINYVDSKGKIIAGTPVKNYQVNSEEDLEILKTAHCGPGTVAYLADSSRTWVFGADEEWHEKVGSESSGGSDAGTSAVVVNADYIIREGGDIESGDVEGMILDKTAQEIYELLFNGTPVFVHMPNEIVEQRAQVCPVIDAYIQSEGSGSFYVSVLYLFEGNLTYRTFYKYEDYDYPVFIYD